MKALVLLIGLIGILSVAASAQAPSDGKAPAKPDSNGATQTAPLPANLPVSALTKEETALIMGLREDKNFLLPSHTTEYKATVINTNFVVPIIRFNPVNDAGSTSNQRGNVSFFNSIGAGVSINRANLALTTNDKGDVIDRDLNNIIGVQVGLLFAANTGDQNNANIFAPTISLSILNFQLGMGYELGNVPTNTKRNFYTVAYAVPVSKLVKGGFYIIKGVYASKLKAHKPSTLGTKHGNKKKGDNDNDEPEKTIQGFY